jgi:hypothetical protein
MIDGLALRRRRGPEDPMSEALALYSLIAAAGFAVGWAAQAFGGF